MVEAPFGGHSEIEPCCRMSARRSLALALWRLSQTITDLMAKVGSSWVFYLGRHFCLVGRVCASGLTRFGYHAEVSDVVGASRFALDALSL